MTETLGKIYSTIMKYGPVGHAELAEIPKLLRRIRHLLRVYYDALITSKKTPEFKYCDMADINDVGLKLHEAGVFLQLSPVRLRALFSSAPEMDVFLFDDPIDIGKWRLEAEAAVQAVKSDEEADDDDRERMIDLEEKSGNDCASYQMIFFIGDLLAAFILNPVLDAKDKERAERAMARLVAISTIPVYRSAFGDPLTDAMRPIYWTPKALVRFAHAGGLPALMGDWAESTCKDGICKTAVETLPAKAWNHQTSESLLGVMRELINKVERDGSDITTTPVFANIMHQIYSRYGLDPFERASRLSDSEIIFYFLHRRLSKKPHKFQNAADWISLLAKYNHVPQATRQRHGWMLKTISGRWDCLDLYGCEYSGCPEKSELFQLKERRVRGRRDPAVEDRLFQWGGASKACSRCRHVSYCSVACQKADWKQHQKQCQGEAAKNNNEEI
ncbi:hypothetical protein BJ138DRAFT_1017982 [Hygrophoropsis aurantiaca]|uniref:Uncharacterized protein n=1 Tax=Hygrophoropsis aurantiaca TaxID=72124 RepID=A0ACB7ZVQ6_9AGAM|nr:hypothetical protein BJ138DRAFT_1017982 [Hygrophoropsis aurantiaca]